MFYLIGFAGVMVASTKKEKAISRNIVTDNWRFSAHPWSKEELKATH